MTVEDVTDVDAIFLAELFGCTPRNILHFADSGMPIKQRGKAGKRHRFNAVHCVPWWGGMYICQRAGWSLPRTLETFLLGFFANGQEISGESFNQRQIRARELVGEMGFSAEDYDGALDSLLTHRMLRW